jgi:hypothetical protein
MSQRNTNFNPLTVGSVPTLKVGFTSPFIHNKIIIDKNQLVSYFVNHSLKECAIAFGCSEITIKRKLRGFGIDTSIHNHSPLAYLKSTNRILNKPSDEDIIDLYINQNLDTKSIAERYNVCFNTVRKWVRSLKLRKNAKDVYLSMSARHFKKYGIVHPAQREDVINKTRSSSAIIMYTSLNGTNYNFKSLHELSYALLLDHVGLEWHYGEMKIQYVDNITSKWRIYTIDFTVVNKDKVEWVEVKHKNQAIWSDRRIYASRRAEDSGTIYRIITDKERDDGWELLKSGYRKDLIKFKMPSIRSYSKQINVCFNSIDMADSFNIPFGWRKHTLVKHSDNLLILKLRKKDDKVSTI